MNVLVTGGAGYLGSKLLLTLGKEFPEATITSIDNLATGDYSYVAMLKKDKRYRLLVGDISKKADLQKAITKETDAIVHLAAVPGLKLCRDHPKNAVDTNFYGTYLLLEKAVEYNIERFVFTSSAAVYGKPQQQPITEEHPLKPINFYGVTKTAAEQLINAYHISNGLTTTIFRLSNLYGLGVYSRWKTVVPKFVWQMVNDQSLTVRGDGKQERNFVHVRDVVGAVVRCLNASKHVVAGETFNIGGETMSVNRVAEIITQVAEQRLGKKITKVRTPKKPDEVYTTEFSYDYKKASRKIGYEPKQEIFHGVSELVDYALKVKASES
jgi:UDP-glucose 4-epimerase